MLAHRAGVCHAPSPPGGRRHRRGVTRGGGSVPGQALKMGVPVSLRAAPDRGSISPGPCGVDASQCAARRPGRDPVTGWCRDRESSVPVFRLLSGPGGPPVCGWPQVRPVTSRTAPGCPPAPPRLRQCRGAVATRVDHFKIATCP